MQISFACKSHLHANDEPLVKGRQSTYQRKIRKKETKDSSSQKAKHKHRCWKVWNQKHKMVVGADVDIEDIPNFLG
jgi:hypothetical protein